MSQHERVLRFIELIRGVPPTEDMDENDTASLIVTEIFTQGNCGNFALALQTAFGGTLYHTTPSDHVLCKIDGRLYDITGDVTGRYDCFEVDEQYIQRQCLVDNYSFDFRGPIV